MNAKDVVICNPARTAIGTYGGTLKDTPAPALRAAVVRETLERAGLAGETVQTVVMGNVIQAGVRMNPARQAALHGGLPVQVPAVRQALERAGWSVGDVERVEINEAFAAIALACTRELGLSEDGVNVEGGAIAHGHPIRASGAVLATRLLHSMRRDGLRRGVVTLCIGGGQGIALSMEMLA